MSSATYNLYSTLGPNVGIWYLQAQSKEASGQPVRLDADLVEWVASPAIVGGGPTRLSVGPYRYTYERDGEVFATNDSNTSQDWFLIPVNSTDFNTFIIAADPRGTRVWTAEEPGQPIKIKVTGGPNQEFKFVRRSM